MVDDWTQLKCLKDDRQIYAIKVVDYLVQENMENHEMTMDMNGLESNGPSAGGDLLNINNGTHNGSIGASVDIQSCVICMEDLPCNELKQHNACDCVMCLPCLERTVGKPSSIEIVLKSYGI